MTVERIIGVDPGQHVGLVVLDIVDGHISGSRYVSSTVMNVSRAGSRTVAENDANLFDRLTEFFEQVCDSDTSLPLSVVLEEPFDASTAWRGHAHQRRGTASRLGTYYGLCLAAARAGVGSFIPLASYPVTNQFKRPGWMRGKTREVVLRDASAALKTMNAPYEVTAYDVVPDSKRPGISSVVYREEHVLMATGVVVYHLSQRRPLDGRRPRITL
jgi:hypothetical protein